VSKQDTDSSETSFYFAFVLRGTEKQYLGLLEHLNNNSNAKLVYQCKSLTYLNVSRDAGVKLSFATPNFFLKSKVAGK
jgi:hypothetical protein